ncbi:MAG: PLP-dependent aminotransferase family protein [Chloroflexota bacterium]
MIHPVQINRQDNLSVYRQIAEQIKSQINQGDLPVGTKLPTIREFSHRLGVTRLTVQNAYNTLQDEGFIEAVVGRGTFVSRIAQPAHIPRILTQQFAPENVLRDVLQNIHAKNLRSLGIAVADPNLFPTEEFWESVAQCQPDAQTLFNYGEVMGDAQLRLAIAEMLVEQNIAATPNQILITDGAMQGLNLVARALARPGDTVLIEQPTFLGLINLLKAQGLHPLTVPLDNQGPNLEVLDSHLRHHRPRFYYTIPSFQNPTGLTFSLEKRQALIELAQSHNLLLIEDDV